jgi:hypothetical protein
MRVPCNIEERELESEHGPFMGVVVTCSRCEAQVEAFGTGKTSIRRCFAMLHDDCDEQNFYHDEDEP